MAAMHAGQRAGGDGRGQQSAGILVHGTEDYPDLSLRVDEHPAPLVELERIYGLWLLDFAAARTFMATSADPTGVYDDSVIEAELRKRLADPASRVYPNLGRPGPPRRTGRTAEVTRADGSRCGRRSAPRWHSTARSR